LKPLSQKVDLSKSFPANALAYRLKEFKWNFLCGVELSVFSDDNFGLHFFGQKSLKRQTFWSFYAEQSKQPMVAAESIKYQI
jgi:hypothetical protein